MSKKLINEIGDTPRGREFLKNYAKTRLGQIRDTGEKTRGIINDNLRRVRDAMLTGIIPPGFFERDSRMRELVRRNQRFYDKGAIGIKRALDILTKENINNFNFVDKILSEARRKPRTFSHASYILGSEGRAEKRGDFSGLPFGIHRAEMTLGLMKAGKLGPKNLQYFIDNPFEPMGRMEHPKAYEERLFGYMKQFGKARSERIAAERLAGQKPKIRGEPHKRPMASD